MTFRNSSDLYSPPPRTRSSGSCAFLPTSFPALLLLTLPGDISEIRQSLSATVRLATRQLVQKLQLSRHSSQIPPPYLQPAILQAVLEDTYIDDGGVCANSPSELSTLQQEIERILNRGGFYIKSWEKSGKNGTSKYNVGQTQRPIQPEVSPQPP